VRGAGEFKTTEERRMAPDMLRSTTNLVKGLGSLVRHRGGVPRRHGVVNREMAPAAVCSSGTAWRHWRLGF